MKLRTHSGGEKLYVSQLNSMSTVLSKIQLNSNTILSFIRTQFTFLDCVSFATDFSNPDLISLRLRLKLIILKVHSMTRRATRTGISLHQRHRGKLSFILCKHMLILYCITSFRSRNHRT